VSVPPHWAFVLDTAKAMRPEGRILDYGLRCSEKVIPESRLLTDCGMARDRATSTSCLGARSLAR
jgi:hypothetical protein